MTTLDPTASDLTAALKSLPPENRKNAIASAFNAMPDTEKKDVVARLSIPAPEGKARDTLWIIVVTAFALVLVISAVTLAAGVFVGVRNGTTPVAKPELVLTLFTTVVGFLGGLFVPSPSGGGKA